MQSSESCQPIISADGLRVCVCSSCELEDLMDSLACHYTGQEEERLVAILSPSLVEDQWT